MNGVTQALWAMTAMAAFGVMGFYFRFWRQTRDRLFAIFAAAFGLLALNWFLLAILRPSEESSHLVYLLRLAAFILILLGIVDKNRASRR